MARLDHASPSHHDDHLVLERGPPGCVTVYYMPYGNYPLPDEILPTDPRTDRIKLLLIDLHGSSITMFPTHTSIGHSKYKQPKYSQIRKLQLVAQHLTYFDADLDGSDDLFSAPYFGAAISATETIDAPLEDMLPNTGYDIARVLEGLPIGFVKDYEYGLGLLSRYKIIVDRIEELTPCTTIAVTPTTQTGVHDDVFVFAESDFVSLRRAIDRIHARANAAAREVRDTDVHNFLAQRLGEIERPLVLGTESIQRMFTQAASGAVPLSPYQDNKLFDLMRRNAPRLAAKKAEELVKLHGEIERASLDRVVEEFENLMGRNVGEKRWQRFLAENPFVLGMAFGRPIVILGEKATVGGQKLFGGGQSIVDFLGKSKFTNHAIVIEIKTPTATLRSKKKPYRRGVYEPSSELSGAVGQVLEQKRKYERYGTHAEDAKDLESYVVHCSVIIGTLPDCNEERRWFEMFRDNSKNVDIITFGELLEKLRDLAAFLKGDGPKPVGPMSEEDLPF